MWVAAIYSAKKSFFEPQRQLLCVKIPTPPSHHHHQKKTINLYALYEAPGAEVGAGSISARPKLNRKRCLAFHAVALSMLVFVLICVDFSNLTTLAVFYSFLSTFSSGLAILTRHLMFSLPFYSSSTFVMWCVRCFRRTLVNDFCTMHFA